MAELRTDPRPGEVGTEAMVERTTGYGCEWDMDIERLELRGGIGEFFLPDPRAHPEVVEEMMTKDDIIYAEGEAERFLARIQELRRHQIWSDTENTFYHSNKYTAAVRRASMDLTRALSRMRKW